MHPNMKSYLLLQLQQLSAVEPGKDWTSMRHPALKFLQEIWGPVCQYQYEGLRIHALTQTCFNAGQPAAKFIYMKRSVKLIIEIYNAPRVDDIPFASNQEHWLEDNERLLSGWLLLRFSSRQLEVCTAACQKQLRQALGSEPALNSLPAHSETDIWKLRKLMIVQLALRRNGRVRPREVAAEFNVSSRSASEWLRRFALEGLLSFAGGQKRTTLYFLKDASKQ